MPPETARQLDPFQRAILLTVWPSAVANEPPAINSPLYTVRASTSPFVPAPSGCQLVPFHRATLLALTPLMPVNRPAAINSPLNAVNARMYEELPETFVARTCQLAPSH